MPLWSLPLNIAKNIGVWCMNNHVQYNNISILTFLKEIYKSCKV